MAVGLVHRAGASCGWTALLRTGEMARERGDALWNYVTVAAGVQFDANVALRGSERTRSQGPQDK